MHGSELADPSREGGLPSGNASCIHTTTVRPTARQRPLPVTRSRSPAPRIHVGNMSKGPAHVEETKRHGTPRQDPGWPATTIDGDTKETNPATEDGSETWYVSPHTWAVNQVRVPAEAEAAAASITMISSALHTTTSSNHQGRGLQPREDEDAQAQVVDIPDPLANAGPASALDAVVHRGHEILGAADADGEMHGSELADPSREGGLPSGNASCIHTTNVRLAATPRHCAV